MKRHMKTTHLSIEVGRTYLLNNGHEVTITQKFREHDMFYSTPFEEGTLRSAFLSNGENYINSQIKIISEVVKA